MGKLGIGWGNKIEAATLSGGTWSAGHPLNNLKLRALYDYAQASTSSSANTKFIADLGSALPLQVFAIKGHNASSAANHTVKQGSTSGGSEVWSATEASWPFTPQEYDGGYFDLITVAPTEQSARYVCFEMDGASVFRASRAFLGRLLTFTYNPEVLEIGWMPDYSTLDRTENGADTAYQRRRLRTVTLGFRGIPDSEVSLLKEVMRIHGTTGEVVFIPDVADLARTQQDGFLGVFGELNRVKHRLKRGEFALTINERGGAP